MAFWLSIDAYTIMRANDEIFSQSDFTSTAKVWHSIKITIKVIVYYVKRETRSGLHSLVVNSTERGHRHCSGELKHLLLTCIEGCAVVYKVILIGSKFMLLQLAGMRTVLKIDLCAVQLGR